MRRRYRQGRDEIHAFLTTIKTLKFSPLKDKFWPKIRRGEKDHGDAGVLNNEKRVKIRRISLQKRLQRKM